MTCLSLLASLVALSTLPGSADAQCHLEGVARGTLVRVEPGNGLPAFGVFTDGQRISMDQTSEPTMRAEVDGTLAFEGDVEVSSLQLHVASSDQYLGGVLSIDEGASLGVLNISGGSVEVQMQLQQGVAITTRIACSDLALGGGPGSLPEVSVDGSRWRSRLPSIDVHAEPGAREVALTLRGPILFEGISREGSWRRVIARGQGGHVVGWVHANSLRVIPRGQGRQARVPRIRTGVSRGYHPYEGLAIVRPGTPVSAAEAGVPWATTVGINHYLVRAWPGNEWVQLVTIPGLAQSHSAAFERAWVPRDSVTYLHIVPSARLLTPRFAESSIPTQPSVARPQAPTLNRRRP